MQELKEKLIPERHFTVFLSSLMWEEIASSGRPGAGELTGGDTVYHIVCITTIVF